VLAVARALIEQSGADALTMRAVASRLGVAPNALYSHVASRNALLDAVLDDLLGLVESPAADAEDPVAAVAALMTSTWDVLTAHPTLVPLFLARQGARGANAMALGQVMDVLLARAGLVDPAVGDARRVLIVHTIGSAAFATGVPGEPVSERHVSPEAARRSFVQSLQWLLAGITAG
jgi:AcrR family transcriptional regulator